MLAVLRRDGNSRTLEHLAPLFTRARCRHSCHNTGFKGEQIWSYGGPVLYWEWALAVAEWVQCEVSTHTHTRTVETLQLSPGETLHPGSN